MQTQNYLQLQITTQTCYASYHLLVWDSLIWRVNLFENHRPIVTIAKGECKHIDALNPSLNPKCTLVLIWPLIQAAPRFLSSASKIAASRYVSRPTASCFHASHCTLAPVKQSEHGKYCFCNWQRTNATALHLRKMSPSSYGWAGCVCEVSGMCSAQIWVACRGGTKSFHSFVSQWAIALVEVHHITKRGNHHCLCRPVIFTCETPTANETKKPHTAQLARFSVFNLRIPVLYQFALVHFWMCSVLWLTWL